MLPARARLQGPSTRVVTRPSAQPSSLPPWPAFSVVRSVRSFGKLAAIGHDWDEPQAARVRWAIVRPSTGSSLPRLNRSRSDARRGFSISAARTSPLSSVRATSSPPPPVPPPPTFTPGPPPPSAPTLPPSATKPLRTKFKRRIAGPSPPSAPPPSSRPSAAPAPPPPSALRPPAHDDATPLRISPAPPAPSSTSSPLSFALDEPPEEDQPPPGDETVEPSAEPESVLSAYKPAPLPPGQHPAALFGPQDRRNPIRISAPRELAPVLSFNQLLPPASGPYLAQRHAARSRPTEFRERHAKRQSSKLGVGKWLSRSAPDSGRRIETRDNQPFVGGRGHGASSSPLATQPSYSLLASSQKSELTTSHDIKARGPDALPAAVYAQRIVAEAMEVMSYAPLASPYLRPDAVPPAEELTERQQQLAQDLSRRLTDRAIVEHAQTKRADEALEIFDFSYPGWSPSQWKQEHNVPEQRPSGETVPDQAIVHALAHSLTRTGRPERADQLLSHVQQFMDSTAEPTKERLFEKLRTQFGLRNWAGMREVYREIEGHPARPLEDATFAAHVFKRLMLIGRATHSPWHSFVWIREAAKHGVQVGLSELLELVRASATSGQIETAAKLWRFAQQHPLKTAEDRQHFCSIFNACLSLFSEPRSASKCPHIKQLDYKHVSHLVGTAIQSGKLDPDPETYSIVMRAAAEEENYDAAREVMRTMEEVGVHGVTFPASARHYDALLLALDRQLPHKRRQMIAQFARGVVRRRFETAEQRLMQAREKALTTENVFRRTFAVVDEIKERHIELTGAALVRLVRMLIYSPETRPQSIRLGIALAASLPEEGEGFSARNVWAMTNSLTITRSPTNPAQRLLSVLFTSFLQAGELHKQRLALRAFDRMLHLRKDYAPSIADMATILQLSGETGETELLERVWEMAIGLAITGTIERAPPIVEDSSLFEQPEGTTAPSLSRLVPAEWAPPLNSKNYGLAKQAELQQKHLGRALAVLFAVVNRSISPHALQYLEREWLRVYQLGFSFDAAAWSHLAQAYLGAGRYERGFQIINDVVLYRHNQLLRQFELAHDGHAVPSAPSFVDDGEGNELLAEEIRRAPQHYQDMVMSSYNLPYERSPFIDRDQELLAVIGLCDALYGDATNAGGGISSSPFATVTERPTNKTIAPASLVRNTNLMNDVAQAVSWGPTLAVVNALESAQHEIRAEALRQWQEDEPGLDGENPLRRAERFLANYPRVQHMLAVRAERGQKNTSGPMRLRGNGEFEFVRS